MSHNRKAESLNSINPYLDGRREWNERYGSYIKQAYVWRVVAFLALLVSMLAVGGVVYIGSKSKFIPYIVQVDKLGDAVATYRATEAAKADVRVIKYSLAEFIKDFRTVYPDPEIQKDYVFKTYRYLANQSPAFIKVSDFYRKNSPFKRAQDERVSVDIKSVIQMSKNTWQIDWSEEVTNRKGVVISTNNYRALATIDIITPNRESEILKNPIGLYIKEFNWSKLLK